MIPLFKRTSNIHLLHLLRKFRNIFGAKEAFKETVFPGLQSITLTPKI